MTSESPNVPGLTTEQRRAVVDWLSGQPRISRAVVFGSRARGDHHQGSDLDVSIDLTEDRRDAAEGLWIVRRREWNAALSAASGLDVRLVRITSEDDGGVAAGVTADGIEVWNRARMS